MRTTVGALLRRARVRQRLTQNDLANLTAKTPTRVSRTTISDLERGRSLPSLDVFVSLSRALHLDPRDFLERIDTSASPGVDLTGVPRADAENRATALLVEGNAREALAWYDALLDGLALDPPAEPDRMRVLHARYELCRAEALRRLGAISSAQRSTERALEVSGGNPDLMTRAYFVLASVLSHRGMLELASVAADNAVRLAERLGTPDLLARAWMQRGSVLCRRGRFEEARSAFRKALSIQDGNDVRLHVQLEGDIGVCLQEIGNLKQARAHYVDAIKRARRHDDPIAEAPWLVRFGRIELDAGRIDDAERAMLSALRIAHAYHLDVVAFRAHWLGHDIAEARDDHDARATRRGHLDRLYPRVREQRSLGAVRAYERRVLGLTDERSSNRAPDR